MQVDHRMGQEVFEGPKLRELWQQGGGSQHGPVDLDSLCLGQTGRGQTPDTTQETLQPDSKMKAKITLKSLGLKWLCPHTETRTAPCLSFPGWEGSSLAFVAMGPSQQGKLRL